jgi:hypothetical protein
MSRRVHHADADIAQLDHITVPKSFVWKLSVTCFMNINFRPGTRRQLCVSRDVVGVQVSFDDMGDLQAAALRGFQVFTHIPVRINDRGNPL